MGSLQWALLAHNLAHWEAVRRPVLAATPVYDLDRGQHSGVCVFGCIHPTT
jgi:hypothetical protein